MPGDIWAMSSTTSAAASVSVLLFGRYAEALRSERFDLALAPGDTVADVVVRLRQLPGGDVLPLRPLCARNQAHCGPETALAPGDELALLPPLAGG